MILYILLLTFEIVNSLSLNELNDISKVDSERNQQIYTLIPSELQQVQRIEFAIEQRKILHCEDANHSQDSSKRLVHPSVPLLFEELLRTHLIPAQNLIDQNELSSSID